MDRFDPRKRVALYVDEWGTWWNVEPGTNSAFLYQQNTLRDAVSAVSAPVVELHLTNPSAREDFRRRNLLEDVVVAGIRGFGVEGYRLALEGLALLLRGTREEA